MDENLVKHRRNLILISAGLMIFELAEGKITGVTTLNVGLSFQNPEVIHYFSYCVFIYFLWRFWVYAQKEHGLFNKDVDSYIKKRLTLYGEFLNEFRSKSGIDESEGFQKFAVENQENIDFIPTPVEGNFEYKIFRRYLNFKYKNNYDFDNKEYRKKLPFIKFEFCWACAFFISILNKKASSDVIFPYLLALIVLTVVICKKFNLF